ncbi:MULTISPECIES: hypothetical protein [unclassified Bradyrhizobium]|uniref:hypothetical protein n=1 Tax=unclassified Bradyrhizobium TaxID=2631580 RepID=UPI00247A9C4A|nr:MULTISPECIES: hypothetical protein [unclassified Bradyrhizobium]WGR72576.1 hypothetical protein MTX24_06460 [Bradyrhizobium sp. ISRA426]WGR77409.1 hypothetical protein MTX21_31410 [Bradyrhizobium sp. ISRA430]WGR87815.1 hypothetical protein MTX25_06460 [Bradyrhizobium sp. ISRA432]
MYILKNSIPATGRRGACCPATRLNNDAVANPPQGLTNRKTRKAYRTAALRKIISAALMQTGSRLRQHANARPRAIVCEDLGLCSHQPVSIGRRLAPSARRQSLGSLLALWKRKLLRGQALPDMRDSGGKVAQYCVPPYAKRAKFVNFSKIGPKFLAVQRRTF